jgi:hypothetical protein
LEPKFRVDQDPQVFAVALMPDRDRVRHPAFQMHRQELRGTEILEYRPIKAKCSQLQRDHQYAENQAESTDDIGLAL